MPVLDASDPQRASSWDELARAHHAEILSYARSLARDPHDAFDITQEVLLRLGITPALPREWTKSWLWTVVRNASIDHRRRSMRRRWVELDDLDLASDASCPAETAVSTEVTVAIQAAVDALPADFRAVFELRYVAELAYEEIADRLGVPVGTVRSRLHRARARLAPFAAGLAEAS